jgi:hypothetical protein
LGTAWNPLESLQDDAIEYVELTGPKPRTTSTH